MAGRALTATMQGRETGYRLACEVEGKGKALLRRRSGFRYCYCN